MAPLATLLQSNRFLVTTEVLPPKGVDLKEQLAKAERLRSLADAFNVTDSHGSIMTQSAIGLARMLVERGIEPILQITCRDRNRIALQADLLAAAALGVHNILCLTGDDPRTGDHPDAKPVFDMDAITLLKAASSLNNGRDMAGNALKDAPRLILGAAVNPSAVDVDKELARAEEKVAAGCNFFQTQVIFDTPGPDRFWDRIADLKTPVLAGIMLLRSANMARRMGQLPGITIPPALIAQLESSKDAGQTGVEIAGRLAKEARELCRGVHIMALGWEHRIPEVLERAGVVRTAKDTSAESRA